MRNGFNDLLAAISSARGAASRSRWAALAIVTAAALDGGLLSAGEGRTLAVKQRQWLVREQDINARKEYLLTEKEKSNARIAAARRRLDEASARYAGLLAEVSAVLNFQPPRVRYGAGRFPQVTPFGPNLSAVKPVIRLPEASPRYDWLVNALASTYQEGTSASRELQAALRYDTQLWRQADSLKREYVKLQEEMGTS